MKLLRNVGLGGTVKSEAMNHHERSDERSNECFIRRCVRNDRNMMYDRASVVER